MNSVCVNNSIQAKVPYTVIHIFYQLIALDNIQGCYADILAIENSRPWGSIISQRSIRCYNIRLSLVNGKWYI